MDHEARTELARVRQLMEESRMMAADRGSHFLIWGLAAAVGLLGTYAVVARGIGDPALVWGVVLPLGWALSFAVGWRERRSTPVSTAGGRVLGTLWISSAVTLTLIGVAGLVGPVVPPVSLSGLLAVTFAAPMAATAILTGERWLLGVAAAWWIGGGVMLFVPGRYSLLLMAGMSLLLLAVPGYVARARAKTWSGRVARADRA